MRIIRRLRRSRLSNMLTGAALVAAGFYIAHRVDADGIPNATPLIYSGVLEQDGEPVDGNRFIQIVLWDHATDTADSHRACVTTPTSPTAVTSGAFQLALDDSCVDVIHNNTELWADVVVEGVSLGRTKLGAVPYAVEAARAASVGPAVEARISAATVVTNPSNGEQYSLDAIYCGASAEHDGDLGGYAGAKTMCESVCSSPTAHMCTSGELVRFAAMGGSTPTGWYATGSQAQYDTASDCAGYQSNSVAGAYQDGVVWAGDTPNSESCQYPHPVLCCD